MLWTLIFQSLSLCITHPSQPLLAAPSGFINQPLQILPQVFRRYPSLLSRSRKSRKRTHSGLTRSPHPSPWHSLCPMVQREKSIRGESRLARPVRAIQQDPSQHPDFGCQVLASKNTRQLFKYLVSEATDINYSSPPHSAQIPGQVQL